VRRHSERRRLQRLVRLLRLRPGERVLDVGCGSGWLAHHCRAAGARVWALDLAPAGVSRARGRYPQAASFGVGDAYALPFAPRAFDVVVLSEVLEHLEWVDRALAEAARVLRPRGRAMVSVPYREVILEHLCIHCNRLTPANAHLHSFDGHGLTGRLEAHGLRVEHAALLGNKLLELAGFPHWTRALPLWTWAAVDRCANRILGRAGFLAVLATRVG
jgi:SAM-dependent methyltransferase